MKKRVFGRKFSRAHKGRTALFRSLAREFILQGVVTTTTPKVKTLKPLVDKLVTKSKKETLSGHRALLSFFAQDELVVQKLESEARVRFSDITSGFTKNVRIGTRRGDAASVHRLEWSRERKEQK